MWAGFDRVVIGVRSLEEGAERYAALLGAEPGPLARVGSSCGSERIAYRACEIALANGSVELREGETSPEDMPAGLIELALRSHELEATADALAARGIPGRVHLLERLESSGAKSALRELRLSPAATRGVPIAVREPGGPPPAPPAPDVVHGLDHVVVRTRNADAALALYRDRLGVRLALDRVFEPRGVRLVFLRLGGVTLELAAPLRPAGRESGGDDGPDALWGVAYQTPRPRAARERVAGAGLEVSSVRPGNKPGTEVCTVRDGTCGVPTLLIGPLEDPSEGRP